MENNTSALIKLAARSFRPGRLTRPIGNPFSLLRRSNGGSVTPIATPRQQYLPGFDPRHSMRGPYPSKQMRDDAGVYYGAQLRENGFVKDRQGNWIHRDSYDNSPPAISPVRSKPSLMRRLLDNNTAAGLYHASLGSIAGALGYETYKSIKGNSQDQPTTQPQPTTIPQPTQQNYPSVTGPTPRSLTLPWMN